jgi:hypothetical protein
VSVKAVRDAAARPVQFRGAPGGRLVADDRHHRRSHDQRREGVAPSSIGLRHHLAMRSVAVKTAASP